MSVMTIVPHVEGARSIEWTSADDAQVAVATREFTTYRERGFLAYAVKPDGEEQIFAFDPTAERIMVTAPLVGG